jgi:hypothetical protein
MKRTDRNKFSCNLSGPGINDSKSKVEILLLLEILEFSIIYLMMIWLRSFIQRRKLGSRIVLKELRNAWDTQAKFLLLLGEGSWGQGIFSVFKILVLEPGSKIRPMI